MKQIPFRKSDSFSANQEIPRTLRNLNFHHRIHKVPLPAPHLNHPNPVTVHHSVSCRFISISFISISFSHLRPGLPIFISLTFPTNNMYVLLLSLMRATWPNEFILLYLITRKIFSVIYRSLSSSLCTFLHSPLTSSFLGPNVTLRTILTNTLSLLSCLNMSKNKQV